MAARENKKRTAHLQVAVLALAAALAPCPGARAQILGRGPEVSLGREAASQVEQSMPVDHDPVALSRVRQVGRRLTSVAVVKDLPFEFHVIQGNEVNAFCLPGGFVYVYSGLLQLLPNDDALAFVMAHELSHATRRHGIRQFEKNMGLGLLLTAVLGGNAAVAQETVQTLVGLKFSRDDETDADRNGMALLARAGYDVDAAAEAMLVIRRSSKGSAEPPSLLRSHPATEDRIRMLRQLAEQWKANPQQGPGLLPPATVSLADPAFQARRLSGLEGFPAGACERFPLPLGGRWVYRTSGPAGSGTASQAVAERMTMAPDGIYRIERDLGRGIRFSQLVATAPDRILVRPATGEAAWRLEALLTPGASEQDGDRQVRCAAAETVEVPAGKFDTTRVEVLDAGGAVISVSWYASGVGLVRRESRVTGTLEELERYVLPLAASPLRQP